MANQKEHRWRGAHRNGAERKFHDCCHVSDTGIFALNNINYHSYDNYYTAVIIIICIFIIAPWLMLHLIKQSFPKMRMAFWPFL